ncbi:MAG: DMT family transporter [Emcibacter sp.]|nr:DMT family transporter [Emcibacter sp.]
MLVGAVAISLAPIFVRLSNLEPVVSAFYRLSFALPFFALLPFLGRAKPELQSTKRNRLSFRDIFMMCICGAMLATDLALWHISINWTSVANATLFNNCAPVILIALGWAFLGERITREVLIALVVASSGIALLMGENFTLSPDQFIGDMVAISTAFFYALYLFLVKSLRARHDTFVIMFGTSLVSAVCLLTVCVMNGWGMALIDMRSWSIVLGLALVCHVFGQSLIAGALADLPVATSSFGLLVQPVSAAVLAWILFNEALSLLQCLGGLLVLCSIVLSSRARQSVKRG